MFGPLPMSDRSEKIRKLAWVALSRAVLGAATAIGTKLGERLVDSLFGDDSDDSDDGEDPEAGQ